MSSYRREGCALCYCPTPISFTELASPPPLHRDSPCFTSKPRAGPHLADKLFLPLSCRLSLFLPLSSTREREGYYYSILLSNLDTLVIPFTLHSQAFLSRYIIWTTVDPLAHHRWKLQTVSSVNIPNNSGVIRPAQLSFICATFKTTPPPYCPTKQWAAQ